MKKLSKKQKEFCIRNAIKKHIHEMKRKEKRKRLRYSVLSKKIKFHRTKKYSEHPEKVTYIDCDAPTEFSLIRNPEIVISYFENAEKYLKKNQPINFNLKEVQFMGPETLTYLCALINSKEFTKDTFLKGVSPKDTVIGEMFRKAGFYKFVKPINIINRYNQDIEDELIHRITRTKVQPELAGLLCESAMKHTYGIQNYKNQVFYSILIECMANTLNHAAYTKDIVFNWWLLAYKEPNTKITKFCFLDLGIGIFESLDKKYKDKLTPEWIKSWFIPNNHVKTLKQIFGGEKKTATINIPGRGLGINNIYTLVKGCPNIKGFTMLSNDIHTKIEYNKKDYIGTLNKDFNGTMYYWELVPEN